MQCNVAAALIFVDSQQLNQIDSDRICKGYDTLAVTKVCMQTEKVYVSAFL